MTVAPSVPLEPWRTEPSLGSYLYLGFPICILRNSSTLSLCGYVGVPPTHPFHSHHYYDLPSLTIHGGLTYSQSYLPHIPDVKDGYWYFGFDCSHSFDLMPGLLFENLPPSVREHPTSHGMPDTYRLFGTERTQTYRTFPYVYFECKQLADQLFEIHNGEPHARPSPPR